MKPESEKTLLKRRRKMLDHHTKAQLIGLIEALLDANARWLSGRKVVRDDREGEAGIAAPLGSSCRYHHPAW